MATNQEILNKEVATLTSEVAEDTKAINALADLFASNAATIADLQAQLAAAQANAAPLDFSSLDSQLAVLAANNTKASAIAPVPVPTPAPPDVPVVPATFDPLNPQKGL